jgi:hypothetical protein
MQSWHKFNRTKNIGDMLAIAQANKATIIAIAEVATYAQSQGVKAHGMNLGGRYLKTTPYHQRDKFFYLLLLK